MSIGVTNREFLGPAVADELDSLVVRIRSAMFKDHAQDGAHIPATWQTYQPALHPSTGGAIGNGTLTGSYLVKDHIVFFSISLGVGSTTTMSPSALAISLPRPVSRSAASLPVGQTLGIIGGDFYNGATLAYDGRHVFPIDSNGVWTDAIPDTWAAGDQLTLSGWYPLDPDTKVP